MKERPILFNTEMVRAILDGRKTQTRRAVHNKHVWAIEYMGGSDFGDDYKEFEFAGITYAKPIDDNGKEGAAQWLAYCTEYPEEGCIPIGVGSGSVGDRLWVRETWRQFNSSEECGCSEYPCGCPKNDSYLYKASHDDGESKWKPSIHMPRSACRLILEITNVRVERLQDITEVDAKAEGFEQRVDEWELGARHFFEHTWNTIYNNWHDNPWVWVIEFKVHSVNGKTERNLRNAA